jgi:hypothetical protein
VSTGVGDIAAQRADRSRVVEKPVRGVGMAPPPDDEPETDVPAGQAAGRPDQESN